MKNLLLLFFIITLSFSAVNRKAVCIIDASYSQVKGQIDINFEASTNTTTIGIVLTNTTGLNSAGNGFHIHQFGVDSKSSSCGDAGKHYNPIWNYGEVSARSGKINVNGSANLTATYLSFDGEYGILGRSMVVHDNTTTRLGCCTIRLIQDGTSGNTSSGYSSSTLKARFAGVNATFYESGGMVYMNITTSSALVDSLNYISVRTTDCASGVLYNITTSFTSTVVVDSKITLNNVSATLLGNFAGRAVVRTPINGGSEECVWMTQNSAQNNTNDVYVDTTTPTSGSSSGPTSTTPTTPTPTPSTTNGSSTWIVSLLFLLVVKLF